VLAAVPAAMNASAAARVLAASSANISINQGYYRLAVESFTLGR